MSKLLLILFLPFMLSFSPVHATFVVGLGTGAMSTSQKEFFEATKEYLEKKFGTNEIQFMQPVSLSHLRELIQEKKIDYFISSAGFARTLSREGVRELLIYEPSQGELERNEMGSVFLTRKDLKVDSLENLKGKRFGANHPEAFFSYIVPLGEISFAGYDPQKFFSTIFLNKTPEDLLPALINGQADVVALPGCYWENLSKKDKNLKEKIKPVLVTTVFPCVNSTKKYPNWTLSSTKNSEASFTRKLVTALLEMPASKRSGSWSVQMDLSPIDALLKKLHLGNFSDSKPWTIKEFLQQHSLAVLIFFVFLLFLLSMTLFLYVKLRIRSEQLLTILKEKFRTECAMKETESRLMALQKISTIDHMSSMIAHELPQPLGAVQAYAEGLLRAQNKQSLDDQTLTEILIKIISQTKKVEDIVNSVRKYAKEKKLQKKTSSVNETVGEAIKDFCFAFHCDNGLIHFLPSKAEPVCCLSPLEFELAIYNLLKNAKEALEGQIKPQPKIEVRVEVNEENCFITIGDNGTSLSENDLKRIKAAFSSSKSSGLGIGLSIVRSIIQNHSGKFSIRTNEPSSGLLCEIIIPLVVHSGFREE